MSQPAIVVQDLSKSYRLGAETLKATSLREAITDTLLSPLRRFREAGEVAEDEERTFWALRGVSFEVQPGEVVGIIGRNGAGKSTLLKILSRIVEPTTGLIRLRGRLASLLEVGTGFHPELTGRENIYLNGSILGMKKFEIDRKFDEIVDFAGIDRFLDTPVKRYSSGMYVRLAFAVAAHLEPEILIVDEVLAVGDAEFQKKCLGKMREVASGGGRTVLFVSHNMAAIQNLCTSAILMMAGKIINEGPTDRVISAYMSMSQVSSGVVVDLRDHAGRLSTAKPFFTEIELSQAGRHTTEIQMGDGLTITLKYEYSKPLHGLNIGIIFRNQAGDPMVGFSPTFQDVTVLNGASETGSITCEIPSMNFVENSLSITIISSDSHGEIDWIEGCASFDVSPKDVFGTGRIPPRLAGLVYLPARWSLTS